METSEILAKLTEGRTTRQEHPQSQEVREVAISLLSSTIEDAQLLHTLLSKVVRPLFLKQQHPNLTATGRKKLVPDAPIASRHSDTIDWDDELKFWRNGWTYDLLAFILSQYRVLPSGLEKSTFESQFHLIIPPILNLIDDGHVGYKTQGCKLLRLLCEEVTHCQSEILKRTGLSDVFSDALRTNFMHLPTLTPEDESLMLLSQLYTAFRALVDARFPPTRQQEPQENKEGAVLTLRAAQKTAPATGRPMTAKSTAKTPTALNMTLDTKEKDARQSMLDLIFRHGILASYAHAVDYVRITTLLLHEGSFLISMMGIYSAKYLQMLLPLLRNVLSNPFALACVPLLISALECMEMLVKMCWPRIRAQWWGECLRGLVGCWVQIEDDESVEKEKEEEQELKVVKRKLREITRMLENLVGEDFENAKKRLLDEDDIIRGLFNDNGTNKSGIQGVS